MKITSLKNDRVRLVRALQTRRRVRQRERRFVIEGVRLCEEAVHADVRPDFAFYTARAQERARAVALLNLWKEQGIPCLEVSPAVMKACSDTEVSQGVLAVVPMMELPRPERPTLTLIPDRLRDPGNMGTLLRTALAAGVEQVLLPPGTVDVSNPKVVRAGMGAHFRLPIVAMGWDHIHQAVEGCRVYLAAARSDLLYTDVDWREPAVLIIGGEAKGAGERARALAEAEITIPLAGEVESLNAAVAAAVILFEAARQRRRAG